MYKKLTLLLFSTILVACATKPLKNTPVDYSYEKPVKIGFISKISEYPTHSHIGFTVFGNFVKDMGTSWKLNEYIYQSLSEEFKSQKGYELINLSNKTASEVFFDNENLFVERGDYVELNQKELGRITKQIGVPGLDALVVVKSPKLFYTENLERIKESRGQAGDHGFESRVGEGMSFHSGLGLNMYSIAPKAHYVGWQYLGMIAQRVIPQPEDYENLTAQELSLYEAQFKNNMATKIKEFVSKTP